MVIGVPEPVGGCLIAGPDAISYHKGEFPFMLAIIQTCNFVLNYNHMI